MKKLVFILAMTLAVNTWADTKYGSGADFAEAVPMSKIVQNPDSYVGKEVTVSGTILDVCAKRGCWMQLTTDVKNENFRVKVKDGEIVFPIQARGKKAAAKGTFNKIDMTLEQTKAHLAHIAEENKKKFDPTSVKEPLVVYQVQATGAVIEGN